MDIIAKKQQNLVSMAYADAKIILKVNAIRMLQEEQFVSISIQIMHIVENAIILVLKILVVSAVIVNVQMEKPLVVTVVSLLLLIQKTVESAVKSAKKVKPVNQVIAFVHLEKPFVKMFALISLQI